MKRLYIITREQKETHYGFTATHTHFISVTKTKRLAERERNKDIRFHNSVIDGLFKQGMCFKPTPITKEAYRIYRTALVEK